MAACRRSVYPGGSSARGQWWHCMCGTSVPPAVAASRSGGLACSLRARGALTLKRASVEVWTEGTVTFVHRHPVNSELHVFAVAVELGGTVVTSRRPPEACLRLSDESIYDWNGDACLTQHHL
jgi:hypothetical protein